MKLSWDVDRSTVVNLTIGGFKKKILTVNGDDRPLTLSLRKKSEFPFDLPDGRRATLKTTPHFGSAPDLELRVDDQLMVPTGKTAPKCTACGAIAKPNDRFCETCGAPMAPAENYLHQKHVKDATGAMWALAVLFALAGTIIFFLARSNDAAALAKLAALDPSAQFPNAIGGVKYTVGALRTKILWQEWSILLVNGILASVMVALAFWGRRAPLASILIAAATYAVVIVTSAIVDPASIGQGVVVKIIIILCLFRGIKGALALNSASA